MNPYLEYPSVWEDFHHTFIPLARELLAEQLAPRYFVKIEEQLFIHDMDDESSRRLGRGDVTAAASGDRIAGGGMATLIAPSEVRLPMAADVERHAYLEISDRAGREVVCVLELLSPSNKRSGPDREQYLAKRRQILASNVHLVEIDLLRGFPRMPIEKLPACDYCVLVSRWQVRPRAGTWPLLLRDRLPEIPIPLRAPDDDARLDLQQVLNRAYDSAKYGDFLYDQSPEPPLAPADEFWARGIAASGV
jgi:hypothetical protein